MGISEILESCDIDFSKMKDDNNEFIIKLDLDKDFCRTINYLKGKYGEEFEFMNGFHNSNLNLSDFIDNFIDTKVVADTTIDANANSSTHDICTLRNDMMKPHLKLLAFNKIFYETKKKYGIELAKKWLEEEWTGAFYLHDAATASFVSYSYKGSELVYVRINNSDPLLISFEDLYDYFDIKEKVLSKKDKSTYKNLTGGLFKKSLDVKIWDQGEWSTVKRLIRKPKTENFRFIRLKNGLSQIVTDSHPMITTYDVLPEVKAKDLEEELYCLFTYKSVTSSKGFTDFGSHSNEYALNVLNGDNNYYLVNDRVYKLSKPNDFDFAYDTQIKRIYIAELIKPELIQNGYVLDNKINIKYELGWIVGYILERNIYGIYPINISEPNEKIRERLIKYLDFLNVSYEVIKNNKISINNPIFIDIIKALFIKRDSNGHNYLAPDILKYNYDFFSGLCGGYIDYKVKTTKARNGQIYISSTNRKLLLQMMLILRYFGYYPKEGIPKTSPIRDLDKTEDSNKPIKYTYSFIINITDDSHKFSSIKLNELYSNYSFNKSTTFKVSKSYGSQLVMVNKPLELDDEYVYDITTESGHFICNNILSHNCFAYDLDSLVEKGMFFINNFKTKPAKHLTTFNDHVLEFVSWTSNRTSGAVGLVSYLVYSWYFWNKDVKEGFYLKDPEYYRRQCFQKFIYDLNQPYLRRHLCAFI